MRPGLLQIATSVFALCITNKPLFCWPVCISNPDINVTSISMRYQAPDLDGIYSRSDNIVECTNGIVVLTATVVYINWSNSPNANFLHATDHIAEHMARLVSSCKRNRLSVTLKSETPARCTAVKQFSPQTDINQRDIQSMPCLINRRQITGCSCIISPGKNDLKQDSNNAVEKDHCTAEVSSADFYSCPDDPK